MFREPGFIADTSEAQTLKLQKRIQHEDPLLETHSQ